MRGLWRAIALLVLVGVCAGCGGNQATGKFDDKDKPKPVEQDK